MWVGRGSRIIELEKVAEGTFIRYRRTGLGKENKKVYAVNG